jgi:hypothetical protein
VRVFYQKCDGCYGHDGENHLIIIMLNGTGPGKRR